MNSSAALLLKISAKPAPSIGVVANGDSFSKKYLYMPARMFMIYRLVSSLVACICCCQYRMLWVSKENYRRSKILKYLDIVLMSIIWFSSEVLIL